ncbi:MAG: YfhO family protein [Chloroflexota bacterium]|nr:YfhO family protein [Chloroflexota bacterium]
MTGPSSRAFAGDAPERQARPTASRIVAKGFPDLVWAALMALLAVWVALRLGLFDSWGTVPFDDGTVRLPNGFAGVDHPFHATRAETLRRALADGELLRWVGHHQGGYPVEFYPLGVAWLEVGLWALLLGALPMVAVHKLAVGLIFLLPGLAFSLLARRDGWPLGVAAVAFAAHVAVPGDWEHGGYTELVQWGLVTNVAAATALLFVLVWLTAFLDGGRGHHAAGAALAAAFAVSTNPRSLIALGVVGVGAWLAGANRGTLPRRALRLAVVSGMTVLLAAPESVALLRFSRLYEFVRYEYYAGAADVLASSIQAVSPPVFAFGAAGLLAAWWLLARPVTRAAAATLLLYAAATMLLAQMGEDSPVPQLEATRLMPFQRLLTIYLAAAALHLLVRSAVARLAHGRARLADAIVVVAAGALLFAYVAPAGAETPEPAIPPPPERGLYPVADTVAPAQADLQTAIEAADVAAPPGTAILVLGSALSWHQRLSAPLWTDRPLYYDNWLWYWQPRHAGPPGYAFAQGHAYSYPSLALAPDFLARHGIGAVVVTEAPGDDAKASAAESDTLRPVRSGIFDVSAVREPTTIVTFPGGNAAAGDVGNQRIVATGRGGGEIVVRRNWFPRWRATVNGEPVPISRRDDGYMGVRVPPGEARLELVYATDALDWIARGAALAGLVAVASAVAAPRVRRRRTPGE